MHLHRLGHHRCCCCHPLLLYGGGTTVEGSRDSRYHDIVRWKVVCGWKCHVTWSVRILAGYINTCFSLRFPLIPLYHMYYSQYIYILYIDIMYLKGRLEPVQTGFNRFYIFNKSMQLQPTRYKFLRQPNRKKNRTAVQSGLVPVFFRFIGLDL